jgi:hypothetical protein
MLAGEGLSSGQSGTIPACCQVALCPRDLLAGAGASRWAPEPPSIGARACLLVIGGSNPPAGPLQAFAARLACPRIPRSAVDLARRRLTDHARPPGRDAARLTAICNECANGVNVPLCPPVSASIRVTLQSYHLHRILRLILCNLQIYLYAERFSCIGPTLGRLHSGRLARAWHRAVSSPSWMPLKPRGRVIDTRSRV